MSQTAEEKQETATQVERKVCPLKFNSGTLYTDDNLRLDACLCEGERCAWWNPPLGVCSLRRIGMYQ